MVFRDVIYRFIGEKLSGRKNVYETRRFYIHAPRSPAPYISYGKNQKDKDWAGVSGWNYKGRIYLLDSKIDFHDDSKKLNILDRDRRMWDIIIDELDEPAAYDEVKTIFGRFGWITNGNTINQAIYNANEDYFEQHRNDYFGGSSINKNYNMNKSYIKRKSTNKNKNKKMMKKTKKTKKTKKSKKFKKFKKTNK